MSSHISVIGIHEQEALNDFIRGAYAPETTESYPDPSGKASVKIRSGNAGIWVHTSNGCFVPFYHAETRVRVRPVEWMEDPAGCPYCANLGVEVLNPDGKVNYPLAITFGNRWKAQEAIELGAELELPIVGFVERIQQWVSLEALLATQEVIEYQGNKIQFQPGWFFPFGPYAAMESQRNSSPRAGFYAWVEGIREEENAVTGQNYRVVDARCGSAVYTLLLDETQCSNLQTGNVVYVECWMCVAI